MKKLQNNFTTPEQSKRLLELGVPADSADCYCFMNEQVHDISAVSYHKDNPNVTYTDFLNLFIEPIGHKYYSPCWSVGRLIEIYGICTGIAFFELPIDYNNQIEDMIGLIKDAIDAEWLDFSKLEE